MILQTKIFCCPVTSNSQIINIEDNINTFLKDYDESDIEGIEYVLHENDLFVFISYVIPDESIEEKVLKIVKEEKLI